ncbi:adhesion G protein-coupled receptor F5 isoform X2 [Rhineura floridana]|uniref:adhesion G protein-coupled receptor F5 isoform X2 n=1 Tax=Rhineura floridana TaxID=261503 RepID=UPI002AC80680|nr:adhesion G protein-coupled receptor F5 isoform X2 [Rhineura floridana]
MLPWKITMFCTLMVVSSSSQDFNVDSLIHSSVHRLSKGGREEESRQREIHKQKQQGISPVEYTIAIEISFANSSFLEPLRSYVNNLTFPLSVNASESAVNISSFNVTTVCNSTGIDSTYCYCEYGYEWPVEACKATPACHNTTVALEESCNCIAQLPSQGTYCQLQSEGAHFTYIVKMSVWLAKPFENDLRNSSSAMFKQYKSDLEKAFTEGYKSLPGFINVIVTGFRPGSIIVQHEVTSARNIPDENAYTKITEALDHSYNLISTSFERSSMEILGGTNFFISPDHIFEGDTVTMTCESKSSSSNVTWYLSGRLISNSSGRHCIMNEVRNGKSTSALKITSIKWEDSGDYCCTFTEWANNISLIYKAVDNITVSPIKIVPSEDVVTVCNGDTKELSCCTDQEMQLFTYYWKTNGAINISGTTTSTYNCTKYLLQANESQCPADQSGTKTDYICELNTTYGARKNKVISVTYFRVANVSMLSSINGRISEGHNFSLRCISDVSNYDQVSWQIQTGSSIKSVDSVWYTTTKTQIGAESVLTVGSANQNWAGFLNSSAHTGIEVFPLLLKKDIIRDPIEAFIPCPGTQVLKCCTGKMGNYTVTFFDLQRPPPIKAERKEKGNLNCYHHTIKVTADYCNSAGHVFQVFCEFTNQIDGSVQSSPMSLNLLQVKNITCNSSAIGSGENGAVITKPCLDSNHVRGNITYKCERTEWTAAGNSCLAVPINELLNSAELLVTSPESVQNLPEFLIRLNHTIKGEQQNINTKAANLEAVVEILNLISVVPVDAKQATMENFLSTVDTIISSPTETWKDFKNGSSRLLDSVEQFSGSLRPINSTIPPIRYDSLQLKGVVIDKNNVSDYNKSFTFSKPSDLSGTVLIDEAKIRTGKSNFTIISVAYSTLGHIIPQYNKTNGLVNGLVLTTVMSACSNLSEDFLINMTFKKNNKTLKNPQCVFWNFSLSGNGGGWDHAGCESEDNGDSVTCSCNHLTSFSILMSPSHENSWDKWDYISYIGVSISILSLLVCIGIELVVWKSVTKTRISYMRHVCILNIALSLLIADIWFIVVAAMHDKNEQLDQKWICTAATFFIHFFYLCVFFWMLTLGLMLFYHLVFILHNTSKTIMKALGFCLGYICPLAISTITTASTHPHYTRKNICLLNWDENRALLALVIPAMIIVAINTIVTIVVIAKIPRRSIGERSISEEKSSLYRIAKSIGVLTPLLGLTWVFGLATVFPRSPRVFHDLFTLFNAFQGLFILLLGTLSDRKVREAVLNKCSLSRWRSQHTKSTSQGMSAPMLSISSPFSKTLNNLFGKAGKYQVSSTESASSSSSENTSKAYSLLT